MPNLVMEMEKIPTGKYARMRLHYLKKSKKEEYIILLMDKKLNEHLTQIQTTATQMLQQIIKKLAIQDGTTEKLKEQDQMKWTALMNNYKMIAEEQIMNDLIYSQKNKLKKQRKTLIYKLKNSKFKIQQKQTILLFFQFTHSNLFDSEHNALGGWAGDLLQLGGTIEGKNLTLNASQINGLLANTDDGYAKSLGFETSESAGFSYEDWLHDIDAVNLYLEIFNGVEIHIAFRDYYSGDAYNKKYETFLQRTIPGSATDRESVLAYVKRYTTPNSLATATVFGKHFGYNGKNQDALAEAFTNEIMDYYESE